MFIHRLFKAFRVCTLTSAAGSERKPAMRRIPSNSRIRFWFTVKAAEFPNVSSIRHRSSGLLLVCRHDRSIFNCCGSKLPGDWWMISPDLTSTGRGQTTSSPDTLASRLPGWRETSLGRLLLDHHFSCSSWSSPRWGVCTTRKKLQLQQLFQATLSCCRTWE